jgi:uncharacterized protein
MESLFGTGLPVEVAPEACPPLAVNGLLWPIRGHAASGRLNAMPDAALYILAVALIVIGLIGAVLPNLPGVPMIFGGIWLAAAVDDYHHLNTTWLIILGVLAAVGIAMDFIAASLGAKRVGASSMAVWGASIGTVVGLFFGLPGLILGPFVGALAGELVSSRSVLRSAHVGIGTWLGLLFGALVKLVLSVVMVALAAGVWLLHL